MPSTNKHSAVLQLGFRPFFAAAGLFSVLGTLAWAGMYIAGLDLATMMMQPIVWHAHEMIFGYTMAVIAGFLLTAVRNWTGVQTLHGLPLLLLLLLWLAARLLSLAGSVVPPLILAGIDGAFLAGLTVALAIPVVRVGQWKQFGIISKILLLMASNAVWRLYTSDADDD